MIRGKLAISAFESLSNNHVSCCSLEDACIVGWAIEIVLYLGLCLIILLGSSLFFNCR